MIAIRASADWPPSLGARLSWAPRNGRIRAVGSGIRLVHLAFLARFLRAKGMILFYSRERVSFPWPSLMMELVARLSLWPAEGTRSKQPVAPSIRVDLHMGTSRTTLWKVLERVIGSANLPMRASLLDTEGRRALPPQSWGKRQLWTIVKRGAALSGPWRRKSESVQPNAVARTSVPSKGITGFLQRSSPLMLVAANTPLFGVWCRKSESVQPNVVVQARTPSKVVTPLLQRSSPLTVAAINTPRREMPPSDFAIGPREASSPQPAPAFAFQRLSTIPADEPSPRAHERAATPRSSFVDQLFDRAAQSAPFEGLSLRVLPAHLSAPVSAATSLADNPQVQRSSAAPNTDISGNSQRSFSRADINVVAENVAKIIKRQDRLERESRGLI